MVSYVGANIDHSADRIKTALCALGILPPIIIMSDAMPMPLHIGWGIGLALYATGVTGYAGWDFFYNAYQELRQHQCSMNALVTINSLGALIYGITILASEKDQTSMEAIDFLSLPLINLATITAVRMIRNHIQKRISQKINNMQTTLAALLPPAIDDASPIHAGDTITIATGEIIPVDGTIQSPAATIGKTIISTGEAGNVEKKMHEMVFAGEINRGSAITVQASCHSNESYLYRLIHDHPHTSKKPYKISDKMAAYFVPGIIITTILFASIVSITDGPEIGIKTAIVALFAVCPCPFNLAVTLPILIGHYEAKNRHIIVMQDDIFLKLKKVKHAIFDITGTLTQPTVATTQHINDDLLHRIASLEQNQSHPLARAIVQYASHKNRSATPLPAHDISTKNSSGITGRIDEQHIAIGNNVFITDITKTPIDDINKTDMQIVYVAVNRQYHGAYIAFTQTPCPETQPCIAALKNKNMRITLLSGGNTGCEKTFSTEFNVAEENILTGKKPQEKADIIQALQTKTLYIGDGVNDGGAFGAATVSLAFGSHTMIGTHADAMIHHNLLDIPYLIDLSTNVRSHIKQNMIVVLSCNIILMGAVLASPFLDYDIPPMYFCLLMGFFSLFVSLNAMRLLTINPPEPVPDVDNNINLPQHVFKIHIKECCGPIVCRLALQEAFSGCTLSDDGILTVYSDLDDHSIMQEINTLSPDYQPRLLTHQPTSRSPRLYFSHSMDEPLTSLHPAHYGTT